MTFPSDLPVDTNHPLPKRALVREENDRIRARIKALKPGESFFLPCPPDYTNQLWQARIAGVANRLLGKKQITTQQTTENGVVGLRVWKR